MAEFENDRSAPEASESASADLAEPVRRDRLPLVAFAATVAVVILLGCGVAYVISRADHRTRTATGAGTLVTGNETTLFASTTGIQVGEVDGRPFAGLTKLRAEQLAARDLKRFVRTSGQGIPSGAILGTNPTAIARTRCFDGGRWRDYWKVTLSGTTQMFESRASGLLYCNRDSHAIVLSPSIGH